MAHDVNPSGTDIAAQVRSALVAMTEAERVELWIPKSTIWVFEDGVLTLYFENDAASQFARNLEPELTASLHQVCGGDARLAFEVAESAVQPTPYLSSSSSSSLDKGTHLQRKYPTAASVRSNATLGDGGTASVSRELSQQSPARQLRIHRSEGGASPRSAIGCAVPSAAPAQAAVNNEIIFGSCNEMGEAAVKMVVAQPGRYSPLLLHGPSGSGKTLLAASMAQQLRVNRRLPRVIHMSSEQFLNEFTEGLRGGGLPMFRRKYRDVEALILEDIQFFINKKSSISEVKHTLDNLLQRGKQVVLTADRSFNELGQLGSDLVVRIRGGLVAPLMPLDVQTREELLKRKLAEAGIEVEDSVASGIAERVAGDGRLINGIVNRLAAVAAFSRGRLDEQRCWAAIGDLVQATQSVVRLTDIERTVCDLFGLESNSLQSPSKMRRVSQPRMLAMFLARKHTPSAYKEIGSYFGKRRHSTVISAEKTVENWLQENADLVLGRGLTVREAIRQVESRLQVG